MGRKKITIAGLAKSLGLSPTAVSFVLNGRDQGISAATRDRVVRAAMEAGYRKPAKVNMLDWTRVAYVSANIHYFNFYTSFYAGVYQHLQRKAIERKIELFLLELNPTAPAEELYRRIDMFRSFGVEVCLSHHSGVVGVLLKNGFKCALLQGGRRSDCVCVYCDDLSAGAEAARHAFAMGHRKAGMIFLSSNREYPRFKGFFETFIALGGEIPENAQWVLSHEHDKQEKEVKEKARALSALPTFFYCYADNILFPIIRGFAAAGLKVPDDVSVMGTDNLYWGKYAMPAFSTVDLNEELFAEKALDAVAHVKASGPPYELAVPARLLPRETVRDLNAPKKRRATKN